MSNTGVKSDMRVYFSKKGRAKYISHLDLSRCFQRALSRSGLPVWYTQGFNPHMYLTFTLPLSLGAESECESFDCRFTGPVDLAAATERLQAQLPEGITVQKIAPPGFKPAEITWADYTLRLFYPALRKKDIAAEFAELWDMEQVPVKKATKRGETVINLKDYCTLQECAFIDGVLILKVRLAAGGTMNVNPNLLIEAATAHLGAEPLKVRIVRKKLYDALFLPLE